MTLMTGLMYIHTNIMASVSGVNWRAAVAIRYASNCSLFMFFFLLFVDYQDSETMGSLPKAFVMSANNSYTIPRSMGIRS